MGKGQRYVCVFKSTELINYLTSLGKEVIPETIILYLTLFPSKRVV